MTPQPSKDMNDRIEKFLLWVMANRDTDPNRWMDEIEPELLKQLKSIISQTLNDCLPESSTLEKHIKPNRQIGTPYLSKFDLGYNQAIDQIKQNLINKLESK